MQYVLGETKDKVVKTPEWAAEICGVSPEQIREFAKMMSTGRTQIPIWLVYSTSTTR